MNAMPRVALGAIADLIPGFAFPSDGFNTEHRGLPVVRIRDVVPGISETSYAGPYDPRYIVSDADCLIGMDGDFNVGVWAGGSALLNQRVCKVAAIPGVADSRYLFWFLPGALARVNAATPYATVKHLSIKVLRELLVPLPPLDEQRRIAAILDQAATLRARRRECTDRSERLVASLFRDAASAEGTRRLPLGEVGVNFSSGRSIVAEGGLGHPSNRVLKVSAVSSGRFLAHEAKALPDDYEPPHHHEARPGDWLFTRASGSVDLIGIVVQVPPGTVDLYLPDKLWRVEYSLDSVLRPECFAALVKEPRFRSFVANAASGASGVRNISQAKVLRYEVDVPPIDAQVRFARRFEASQKVRARAAEQLEALDSLFASLQDRAFKGEL